MSFVYTQGTNWLAKIPVCMCVFSCNIWLCRLAEIIWRCLLCRLCAYGILSCMHLGKERKNKECWKYRSLIPRFPQPPFSCSTVQQQQASELGVKKCWLHLWTNFAAFCIASSGNPRAVVYLPRNVPCHRLTNTFMAWIPLALWYDSGLSRKG